MPHPVAARKRTETGGTGLRDEFCRSARRRFLSARGMCYLVALTVLASSVPAARGQANLAVFESGFPNTNRVGSITGVSGQVANGGNSNAANVVITLTINPTTGAAIQNFSASSGVCDTSSTTSVTCTQANLGPSQSVSFSYEILGTSPGDYTATVCATTTSPESGTADNTNLFHFTFDPAALTYFINGVQVSKDCPISTFSGKEVITEPPDLNLGGPLPIFFQRHYDGAMAEDGVVNSALGPNWQHNHDITLAVNGTNATVGFRRGRVLRFVNDGANWNLTERTDVPFRLLQSGADYVLGDPRSQFMYFFSAGGLWTRIEDGRGNTNFLSYSGTLLTNVNDGLNRHLTLQYDGGGQLTNVTDGIRSVQFVHGSPLTGVVDALGNLTSYSYMTNTNNPALLTARTLPEANTPFAQTYNAEGRVSAQTDGAGNTTAFGYGPAFNGRQTLITNPLGHVTIHLYTGDGEFSQFTDEAGKSIVIQQDSAGRRNFIRDRLNNTTFITYSATNGFPTLINLPSNPDESFTYSPRLVNGFTYFDLTRTIHPDISSNLFGYDAQGNLISHTNRVGDLWRYGYNARGQLLSVTNPLGGTATFTYDANARLDSSTDSDIGVTTYEYDSLNRLTKLTHPNPTSVQFTRDALDRLTSVTDERTNTTAYQYDGNSRLTNMVNALNQSTRYEYDAVNRLVRTVDRLGRSARLGYDPRSLLVSLTNRNGFVTRFDYDGRQRLTAVINPGNATNSFQYDDNGLLIAASNPLNETLRWQRDAMGYVTNLIDALSNRFGLSLDAMKRVTGVTNPLGQKATFAHDRRGLLTNATRELGIAATYRYNALGLLTNLTDPKSSQWNYAYTAMGRLTNFADPLGRATGYEYDSRGRLIRTVYPDAVTQTNTYDGANNLTRVQYSDGTDLQFAYDPLNRTTNAQASPAFEFVWDAEDRLINTRQEGLDFGAAWDADGRLTNATCNSGALVVTYVYDSRDRLTHASDNLSGHGMGFSYDDADRLTTITRSNGVTTTYTYDARGLMTRVQEGSIIDIRYTIDAAARVTEADYVTVPIDPTTVLSNESLTLAFDAASQISSASYQYDPRGRLTNAPNTAFQWDGASRLVGIDAVSLGYNAFRDLITRVEGGTTNHYFYNYALRRFPIVAERNDNTGLFTRYYVWSPGGVLLYLINLPANIVSYPHFDRVGSTLALTDNGGNVTDAYAYNPYGRVLARTGTNQQPFQFVGRSGVRAEPAGNLAHMRARYYDPRTARFLIPEPVWPTLDNPQELNRYQYVLGDPLGLIDPEGTDGEKAERPVEEMSGKELEREALDRMVARENEVRAQQNLPKLEGKALRDFLKDARKELGIYGKGSALKEKILREKLPELRKEDEERRKQAQEKPTPPPMPLPPGGRVVVIPGGRDPVAPPPPGSGGDNGDGDDDGDDDGYDEGKGRFKGFQPSLPYQNATGGGQVSYSPPDGGTTTLLPLSGKEKGLIRDAVNYQTGGDRGPVSGAGDFNGDGTVDAADYVEWRKNGGNPDDYNAWKANFGNTYR